MMSERCHLRFDVIFSADVVHDALQEHGEDAREHDPTRDYDDHENDFHFDRTTTAK
jgi:hypothetical protein